MNKRGGSPSEAVQRPTDRKQFLPKAGKEFADTMRSILIGIVNEAAKKALWPS
jgi:hypothetical protein